MSEEKLHGPNGQYVAQTGVEVKFNPDLHEWWEEETPVADTVMLGKWGFARDSLGHPGESRDHDEEVTSLVRVNVGNALVSLRCKHVYYMLGLFRFFSLYWN